tara:strand:+ start:391 stop:495 length:105 start_codon:yes stop_codon:yes gene_type:complete
MSEAVVLLVSFAVVFVSGALFVVLVDYALNKLDK